MPIDERALRVLEFNKIREMLNQSTQTSLGQELTNELVPVEELGQVQQALLETSEARQILRVANIPFGGIHDIRNYLRICRMGGSVGPEELLAIGETCYGLRQLKNFLAEKREEGIIPSMARTIGSFAALERRIGECITDAGEVADGASPQLQKVRNAIRTCQNRIKDKLDALVRNPQTAKYLQDPIVTIRNERYVVPVRQEYRTQVPGIVHDQSASGATLFIEPMAAVEMNNQVRQLQLAEKEEINRILQELCGLVANQGDELGASLSIAGRLDFIFTKGRLSQEMRGIEPEMNDRGFIRIVQGRHPLLKGKVVPTDVHLGKDFKTLVITGPNTGGKTVTLKTLGLFTLMAQAGLHVPADEGTQLSVFTKVHADIGDEQSIEQSLSTFSSHMTNIVRILASADCRSLVLLDELGAGTDPTEGAALAMSILDHLHNRDVRTAATTHYSELKSFAYTRQGVQNASVEFDIETLSPTYRLLIGVPGKSNAFAIASRLGLNSAIIDHARTMLTQEDIRVEDLIQKLNESQRQIDEDQRAAREMRVKVERQREEYEKLRASLQAKEEQVLARARQEASRLVGAAKREIEDTLAEVRILSAQTSEQERARVAREARVRIQAAVQQNTSKEETPLPVMDDDIARDLKPGETVYLPAYRQKATVVQANEQEAQVQVGALRLTIGVEQMRRTKPDHAPTEIRPGKGGTSAGFTKAQAFNAQLDLRGSLVDEALERIEKYLDDAIIAGIPQVRLVHGKGTGALRSATHQLLRSRDDIKRYRLGETGEGGDGCTVVYLQD